MSEQTADPIGQFRQVAEEAREVLEEVRTVEQASGEELAAMNAAAEATGAGKRTITFGSGENALTLNIPRHWKRFKFMRALARGDISAALDAIWPPTKGEDGEEIPHPSVAALEELDISDEDFTAAMDKIGQAIGGTKAGNSPASPTS